MAPKILPITPPTPPLKLVPPKTAAIMASN